MKTQNSVITAMPFKQHSGGRKKWQAFQLLKIEKKMTKEN